MDSGMIRLTMLSDDQSNAILRIQIFLNKNCVIHVINYNYLCKKYKHQIHEKINLR